MAVLEAVQMQRLNLFPEHVLGLLLIAHPHRVCTVGLLDAFSAVREFANKSAASAASLVYVKFQAVIKSAASAASLRGGRASDRLDCVFLNMF